MSINKFQEKVFRTGCGSAVLYLCAAVFFGGMFYMGCGLGMGGNSQDTNQNRVVAVQVGDQSVYYDDLSKMIDQQRGQAIEQSGRSASPDALAPAEEAQIQANVLDSVVSGNAAHFLAVKAGVKFTDKDISKEEEKEFDQQTMMTRMDLIRSHDLKPDATDKDFDAVLKRKEGMTLTQRKTMFHQRLVEALKDPKVRPQLELSLAKSLLLAAINDSIKPTPAELKASYNTFIFKRIQFAEHPGSTVLSQVAKAQADLKSGLSFEQAVDRYTSEKPPKGKKASESSIDVSPTEFDSIPDYKPLKGMKVGQVSDVIDTPQGKTIYKLISIRNGAPPDLDSPSGKLKYTQSYQLQRAQPILDAKLKDFMKSGQIAWKMAGLKALFDWYQTKQDMSISPSDLPKRMAAIVDEAKKASATGQPDARSAMLAWYAAFDVIWTAPGADKVKLRADRIDLLKALTAAQPYFSLKLELVDLLVDAKAGDEAVDVLKSAASANFMYDVEGQKDFQDVQAKMMKLKDAGILKPAAETELQKIQDEWKKQNTIAEQEKAEQKKQEAIAKKEADANAAKQKAETDKQKAAAAKNGKAAPSSAPPVVSAGGITAKVVPNPPPAKPGPPAANQKSAPTGTVPPPVKKQ